MGVLYSVCHKAAFDNTKFKSKWSVDCFFTRSAIWMVRSPHHSNIPMLCGRCFKILSFKMNKPVTGTYSNPRALVLSPKIWLTQCVYLLATKICRRWLDVMVKNKWLERHERLIWREHLWNARLRKKMSIRKWLGKSDWNNKLDSCKN